MVRVLILVIFCLGAEFGFLGLLGERTQTNLVFSKMTFYHLIRVTLESYKNEDRLKILYLDTTVEGAQFEKSQEIPLAYQRYWALANVFCPNIRRCAFLGGGAYSMPEALINVYPNADVDVVEIDPEVIQVGRLFFKLNEYPKINAISDDARHFLNVTKRRYDLIFGDAYNGVRYIPAHLVTAEFFSIVKEHLSNKGVYMMNIISSVTGKDSELFCAVTKTLSAVFREVYVFAVNSKALDVVQNIILLAPNYPARLEINGNDLDGDSNLKRMLSTFVPATKYDTSKAPLLTDEYNPIEYIVAKTLRDT